MTDDPRRSQDPSTPHYNRPAGGWGSLKSVARHLLTGKARPAVPGVLWRQNKPGGYMCSSCAWAKPPSPHLAEFCENGAKATVWDLTSKRCGPEFFARHSVTQLRSLPDFDLEAEGRLTHPMRYDAASDHYVETTWDQAFAAIGDSLRRLNPQDTVFYASGRASLETSFLYALFARVYGHNNLPDSSNMCHETTSVALKKTIGVPVGTCTLSDFESCDLLMFFGQNPGSNSPRLLHPLQAAAERGCRIITFNPVRERGLLSFMNPQSPGQMLTGQATALSELYFQIRPGSDIAVISGICKRLFETGDVDRSFMAQHCSEAEAFEARMQALSWEEIEQTSGLDRDDLFEIASIFASSQRVIGVYGMGLTQHVRGGQSVAMLVNLLLTGGHIGRPGAGICPVRGHSNVQGQRTVGISEKPELVPLDRLAELFGFDPPRQTGRTTAEVVQGLLDGEVQGLISLGGNLARAIPDQARTEPAWAGLALNVQIATRLNRSHLLVGAGAWLLPCLVRAEEDQAVSVEDSLSHIHGSVGRVRPASAHLLSEAAIVAGLARATLRDNPKLRWADWAADYALVRDLIEAVYPDDFAGYNRRLFQAGGFYRGNPARERQWNTATGKARFTTPDALTALAYPQELTLITLRSNDQFNTTIYGFRDRLRGLEGDRMIVLVAPEDIRRFGLHEGQRVTLVSALADGVDRRLAGLRVTAYDLPAGCVAAYYPEANPLVPLSLRDEQSQTPAYKGAPVRIEA